MIATFVKKDNVVNTGDLLGVIALTQEGIQPLQAKVSALTSPGSATLSPPHVPPANGSGVSEAPTSAVPNMAAHSSTVDPDVRKWLLSLSQEYLDIYEPVLNREGFDTMEAVLTLTEKDLEEMKVLKGHRRVLVASIEEMKKAKEDAKKEEPPTNIGS